MELRFSTEALAELRESADYYSVRSPLAAHGFALAVDHAIQAVLAEPNRFVRVSKRDRARSVEKYPYQIIYRVMGDVLYVVAVAHTARRPGYWKRRR